MFLEIGGECINRAIERDTDLRGRFRWLGNRNRR
jgi:hypothetical protein